MASRLEYSISVTPICTIAAGTEYPSVDTIATDVGKSLGMSSSVAVTWGSTIGYSAGVPTYVACTTSGVSLGTLTSIKGIYIRHTGYSDTGLTVANSANLTIKVTAPGDAEGIFAVLGSGQGIFLPFNSATTPVLKGYAGSGTIQVEVMASA